jgi:hypothetical protein
MERGLTLITTSYPPSSAHLRNTAESVAFARAALSSQLKWILVIDGPGTVPVLGDMADTLVIQTHRSVGLPTARNIALGLVNTEWLMPLDHDDLVDAGGLTSLWRDIEASTQNWFAGNVELVGGGHSPHYCNQSRAFRQRALEEGWTSPFPFYPNAVIARSSSTLAVGGWPALEAAEDLGLVFQLNSRWTGVFEPHTIMRYRVWESQMTRDSRYRNAKARAFNALAAMINARRKLEGRSAITPPNIPGTYGTDSMPTYWADALTTGAPAQEISD